ncbi:uncharacterized protein LOC131308532 [Rhododendron vialii]|uniref:uncharacterized protein LOC131308526 n=1 Tax=Rhododendron vialii TaxID=182163 RepID=UPI00265FF6ED|nr:uncharacterized protein LOC131308526 [Rhododendron vialii]XP_058191452.1 uncharacterized protein LOC131308532 [Rhododendron vialii]
MECEKIENYIWVLEKLKGMMDPNALPSVIVTDRELALMNAIINIFPHATDLLCRWHIGKNILAKYRKMFDDKMLGGAVSLNAMTLVLAVSHQVEWFMESKRECECSLRHTHGLPCAHEIAPYKMANIPLSIELIHDYWKKLSLLAPQNEGLMKETLLAHFDCFYNKFLNEDQYDVKAIKEKPRRSLKGKAKVPAQLWICPFINHFPKAIKPYIKSVKKVEDDGNCGFRAVSGFMKGDVHECSAPRENWMTMPDMGHIIASAYNCVLVHLSNIQCLTFLPLRSEPLPSMKQKDIAIRFVDGEHFVQVFLKSGSPMAPIACNWKRHRLSITKNWDVAHVAAIHKFNEIIGVDVATKERKGDLTHSVLEKPDVNPAERNKGHAVFVSFVPLAPSLTPRDFSSFPLTNHRPIAPLQLIRIFTCKRTSAEPLPTLGDSAREVSFGLWRAMTHQDTTIPIVKEVDETNSAGVAAQTLRALQDGQQQFLET